MGKEKRASLGFEQGKTLKFKSIISYDLFHSLRVLQELFFRLKKSCYSGMEMEVPVDSPQSRKFAFDQLVQLLSKILFGNTQRF